MDKDRVNQPAPDLQPDNPAADIENWSPQPSTVYDLQDNAAAEGAAKPAVDPIAEADRLMEQHQDLSGGCGSQGNSPFVIADHAIQHTDGDLKTALEFDIALRSGRGQSGQPGEPPAMLPTVGDTPPNEVRVIALPVARPRQGA
jgi:hypothetical protein